MTILGALLGFSLLSGVPAPALVTGAAPAAVVPTYTVTMTAYNAVPGQTDDSPLTTASGAFSNPEIVAARSRDLAEELPFGTIIEIFGPASDPNNTCGYGVVEPIIGYRVIEDSMNAKFTKRVDVLVGTSQNFLRPDGSVQNAAKILGVCDGVTVRVVGHVDLEHLPKSQRALAALVTGLGEGLALK